MRRTHASVLAVALFLGAARVAVAADGEFTLTIKDHLFSPATLEVPAGTKITLIVKNEDATPEEFESHDLKREKIIKGGSEVRININPLKPGTYSYVGEYHEDTAKGVIVAK